MIRPSDSQLEAFLTSKVQDIYRELGISRFSLMDKRLLLLARRRVQELERLVQFKTDLEFTNDGELNLVLGPRLTSEGELQFLAWLDRCGLDNNPYSRRQK